VEAERTQNAISGLLRIDRTTIAAIVDDLEAAELVVRHPAPDDRRARLVVPTPAGRALATGPGRGCGPRRTPAWPTCARTGGGS
jgi:DNA-binding MarR family transcriptional regulator